MSTNYRPNYIQIIIEFLRAIYMIMFAPVIKFNSNSILIIMDPIDAYKKLYTPQIIANINKLISIAEKKNIPIILTRWIRTKPPKPIDAIDSKGHWSFYVPPSQTNIMKSISKNNAQIIDVKNTNAFINDEFRCALKDKSELVIAGAWLESCVMNTSRAALDDNKSVFVVSNASTGHFPFNYFSLIDIQMVYGNVASVS